MRKRVKVIISIDTEEDDWGSARPSRSSVANIEHLQGLEGLWARFGARPTYFVNYPPMASRRAAGILRGLVESGAGELGVHCHPWNTPPVAEEIGAPETMMSRLSEDQNLAKLSNLTNLFSDTFQQKPTSFRAGRWAFGRSVARPIHQLGYRVDSSVSPFLDWTGEGGPDYSSSLQSPYFFDPDFPLVPVAGGSLLEIPTSVGFLAGPQRASASVRTTLERSHFARLKLVGILDVLGAFKRRWLSPETSTSGEMIKLARALVRAGNRVLGLTFHSPSLLPGATPFIRNGEEKLRFQERIERFLEFCTRMEFEFATVTEVADSLRPELD